MYSDAMMVIDLVWINLKVTPKMKISAVVHALVYFSNHS